jgi:peptidoglycan/xylan/chitin deacetylase (PgdA/CDA1 family)
MAAPRRRARLLAALFALALPRSAHAGAPAVDGDDHAPRAVQGPERLGHGHVIPGYGAESGLLALTFDDGPSAATTGAVLDELDRAGAHATFFVNAYRLGGHSAAAERQRALLVAEVERGHTVGNHTFDHERLADLPPERQAREILDGESGIARVLGERPWLFRPPYGVMAPAAARTLAQRGYTIVQWNISSEDPYLRTPEKVVARVMEEIRREGGGVVLFHDTHPWTVAALPLFFEALAEENCRRVAAGEEPLLLVELDRFLRPRYGEPPSRGWDASRAEADREARRRIAAACTPGGVDVKAVKRESPR